MSVARRAAGCFARQVLASVIRRRLWRTDDDEAAQVAPLFGVPLSL